MSILWIEFVIWPAVVKTNDDPSKVTDSVCGTKNFIKLSQTIRKPKSDLIFIKRLSVFTIQGDMHSVQKCFMFTYICARKREASFHVKKHAQ